MHFNGQVQVLTIIFLHLCKAMQVLHVVIVIQLAAILMQAGNVLPAINRITSQRPILTILKPDFLKPAKVVILLVPAGNLQVLIIAAFLLHLATLVPHVQNVIPEVITTRHQRIVIVAIVMIIIKV
jgi:hypothetical protein